MYNGVVPPVALFAPSMTGHMKQVVHPSRISGHGSGRMPAQLSCSSTSQVKDSPLASNLSSAAHGSAGFGPPIDRHGFSRKPQNYMAGNGGWGPPTCKIGFPPGLERLPNSDLMYGRPHWRNTRLPLHTRSG